jgi:hypothetical protein
MEKMIIKVTLNSRNPAEAELMGILESVRNRSAYLKMAALHYCDILGKLSHADQNRTEKGQGASRNDSPGKTGKSSSKKIDEKIDEMEFDFTKTFEPLK